MITKIFLELSVATATVLSQGYGVANASSMVILVDGAYYTFRGSTSANSGIRIADIDYGLEDTEAIASATIGDKGIYSHDRNSYGIFFPLELSMALLLL